MPAVERTRLVDPTQIPRPPNSWILYRSDKVARLPPPQPGTTRSQADVSRLISQMWKNESPEVKAEYERRAEVKKLEHASLYPNYRYMPKSKELKEELKRSRDEQKRKKRKQKDGPPQTPDISRPVGLGNPPSSHPPLTSLPFPFFAGDTIPYTQDGPSPPMSAADSPSPESPHLPQQGDAPNEHANDQVVPTSHCLLHAHVPSPSMKHAPSQQLNNRCEQQPASTSHYRIAPDNTQVERHDVYYPQHRSQPAHELQVSQVGQAHEHQHSFPTSVPSQAEASMDYFTFDLQPFASQNLDAWALQHPEFQPSLNQFLNSTGADCYQMQISPFNQPNLNSDAVGPLEIEFGQNFDLSQWQWDGAATLDTETYRSLFEDALTHNTLEQTMLPAANASPSSNPDLPPADAEQGFRFDQFINFDPTFDFIPPAPVEHPQEALAHTPYVPPSGATQSSKRRVAASWNPSFAMTDAIDV